MSSVYVINQVLHSQLLKTAIIQALILVLLLEETCKFFLKNKNHHSYEKNKINAPHYITSFDRKTFCMSKRYQTFPMFNFQNNDRYIYVGTENYCIEGDYVRIFTEHSTSERHFRMDCFDIILLEDIELQKLGEYSPQQSVQNLYTVWEWSVVASELQHATGELRLNEKTDKYLTDVITEFTDNLISKF